jgi:uncharacterized protein (TIGR03905 family)
MVKTYEFYPQGTCSRKMIISYENGILIDFKVVGGCPGNLAGISRLIKGMPLSEISNKLRGTTCGPKSTSCPDQLSIAIDEILANEKIA